MWAWLVVVALLAILPVQPCAAQDADEARREFDDGRRQYERRHFQLALQSFQRAYELLEGDSRAVLILYNVGLAQQELGRYGPAISTFERYLAEAPSDAPNREQTTERLRELRARQAESGGANSAGLGPMEIAGISLLSVGGLAALLAIPTGIVALDGEARLADECPEQLCTPAQQSLIDETRTMALATDALWIAGLSVAAVGAVLLAVARASESPTATTAGAFCTEGGCLASVHGRF